jgi:tRNA(Ile)-lysidine synthase TilS/MesJ
MDKLQRTVLEFIRRQSLLHEGERVVVGFSGGPDSVALVLVIAELAGEGLLPLELLLHYQSRNSAAIAAANRAKTGWFPALLK